MKEELSKPTILAVYNPLAETKVSADSSSYGLGAVLFQKVGDVWKPVVYASRALSETERRYAQIEKEALAVTWACEKFREYILGCHFTIETDHKPLVPLLSGKKLNSMPPRIVRFRLRLAGFDYTIYHVPGKLLYTADTLSRAPITNAEVDDIRVQEEAEALLESVVDSLPTSPQRLEIYRKAQDEDDICLHLKQYCQSGWPAKNMLSPGCQPYWKARANIVESEIILLFNHRIVVPAALQRDTLDKVHTGHQRIERCSARIA